MSDEEYKVEKKIQINIKKDITNIIKRKGGWEKAIKKYFDNFFCFNSQHQKKIAHTFGHGHQHQYTRTSFPCS
jgi:hypothetical protein